jgi:hypothetical protein
VAPTRIPWRALTSRTWLLRGAAAAVLLVLLGSWVVGVAGREGDSPTSERADDPVPTQTPTPEELDPSDVVETTSDPEPSEGVTPSDGLSEEPTPGAVVPVADESSDSPRSPSPQSPSSTPRPPNPAPTKSNPPKPTPSSPNPTPSPTQPSNGCTALSTVVECVLAPITTRP